jgi:hypothetical protein
MLGPIVQECILEMLMCQVFFKMSSRPPAMVKIQMQYRGNENLEDLKIGTIRDFDARLHSGLPDVVVEAALEAQRPKSERLGYAFRPRIRGSGSGGCCSC